MFHAVYNYKKNQVWQTLAFLDLLPTTAWEAQSILSAVHDRCDYQSDQHLRKAISFGCKFHTFPLSMQSAAVWI